VPRHSSPAAGKIEDPAQRWSGWLQP
jgi:hypothetical protein